MRIKHSMYRLSVCSNFPRHHDISFFLSCVFALWMIISVRFLSPSQSGPLWQSGTRCSICGSLALLFEVASSAALLLKIVDITKTHDWVIPLFEGLQLGFGLPTGNKKCYISCIIYPVFCSSSIAATASSNEPSDSSTSFSPCIFIFSYQHTEYHLHSQVQRQNCTSEWSSCRERERERDVQRLILPLIVFIYSQPEWKGPYRATWRVSSVACQTV